MEQNFKLIPFCLEKAKTPSNPNGLDVVTRGGKNVKIICSDFKGIVPIIGIIQTDFYEVCYTFYANGCKRLVGEEDDDLFLKEPITLRRMTHQELSWWLREHSEEHRELKYKSSPHILTTYPYSEVEAKEEVSSECFIRSNGGEWKEPLIEVKEGE